jgi:hypothetical protein
MFRDSAQTKSVDAANLEEMHLSIVLAIALCTAPGFESAPRLTDRKVVANYVDAIRFSPHRRMSLRWWPLDEQDPRVRDLRYSNAYAVVDLFVDHDGSVKAVCLARGDSRLMPLIERPALHLVFDQLNRGERVIVPVRFDFEWPATLFRSDTFTVGPVESFVNGPRLEAVAP